MNSNVQKQNIILTKKNNETENINQNLLKIDNSTFSQGGHIFCLLGIIIGLIIGIILFIVSIIYFSLSNIIASNELQPNISMDKDQTFYILFGSIYLVIGLVLTTMNIINVVLVSRNFKTTHDPKHEMFIAINSILFANIFGIIGGIMILQKNKKVKQKEQHN